MREACLAGLCKQHEQRTSMLQGNFSTPYLFRKTRNPNSEAAVDMVGTRSGRTSYASATEAPKNPKEAKAKVVKNKKAAPANAPKGPKSRGGKTAARPVISNPSPAVTEWLEGVGVQEPTPTPAAPTPPAAPNPRYATPATSKPSVERVLNGLWESTTASLSFVYQSNLHTDQDTETIALNLIDYIIKPENWNPELSWNVLSAACFFFASKVTGKRNTPEKVAFACRVDPQVVAAMAGPQALYDPGVKHRLAQALAVNAEDVKRGYKILYEQKDHLTEFLGGYGEWLSKLPTPDQLKVFAPPKALANARGQGYVRSMDGPSKALLQTLPKPTSAPVEDDDKISWDDDELDNATGDNGAEEKSSAEVVVQVPSPALVKAAEEKASEAELDLFDLDEFDTFVAENE